MIGFLVTRRKRFDAGVRSGGGLALEGFRWLELPPGAPAQRTGHNWSQQ